MSKIFESIMHILIYGKMNEDVVLHCLIGDVKINDDTGILLVKQCDCPNFFIEKSKVSILTEGLKYNTLLYYCPISLIKSYFIG